MTRGKSSNAAPIPPARHEPAPEVREMGLKSAQRALCAAYKNFLFEDPPFCPSLQGETMGRGGLRGVHNRVDLGARTWYRPALWQPQGSGSTKTPSSRSSAITGGPSSRVIRG